MLKKKGRASLKIKKCVFEKNPNQVCALRALEEGWAAPEGIFTFVFYLILLFYIILLTFIFNLFFMFYIIDLYLHFFAFYIILTFIFY